jgi:protein-L-isoaspartate(D-aspartate) O-methyltransferase
MVAGQIAARGIRDERVLEAMRAVPREKFLPPHEADWAYADRALAVGWGQTCSQPYIVAVICEALQIAPSHRVLEVGTGTGYQTVLLARLARQVYTVERIDELSNAAQARVIDSGMTNVTFRIADGSLGWPEAAPFDRIVVSAAAPSVPPALMDQLAEGGRMVLPVGEEGAQHLLTVQRTCEGVVERALVAVRFVRLIGAGGFPE